MTPAPTKPLSTILVVEDESLIRALLVIEFEDAGYCVQQAASADEAVAILSEGAEVSAVVTDIRMPGEMDGVGLVAWLGKYRPGVPVVVLTGASNVPALNALNPDVVAVISKPYKPSSVVALIHKMGVKARKPISE